MALLRIFDEWEEASSEFGLSVPKHSIQSGFSQASGKMNYSVLQTDFGVF